VTFLSLESMGTKASNLLVKELKILTGGSLVSAGGSGGGCQGGCCREVDMILDIRNWRVGKGSLSRAQILRAGLKLFRDDSERAVGAVIRDASRCSAHHNASACITLTL